MRLSLDLTTEQTALWSAWLTINPGEEAHALSWALCRALLYEASLILRSLADQNTAQPRARLAHQEERLSSIRHGLAVQGIEIRWNPETTRAEWRTAATWWEPV